MAQRPDEPPESIILSGFAGVRNTVASERLGVRDLEAAVNVDLDDAGQLRRRRGQTLRMSGNFHSIQKVARGVLGVRDGALGWILPGYAFVSLGLDAGADALLARQVDDVIYFGSRAVSGKIRSNDTIESWGVPASATTWLSPVIAPTDTAGAIAGKLISPPPMVGLFEMYRGRAYLADDKTLWVTELYLYDYVDRTKGFIQFEHTITQIAAVDDGLFVGTEGGIYFLKGSFAQGQRLSLLTQATALPGNYVTVPASKVHPNARQGVVPESDGVVFLTTDGICVGFDGGQLFNLTQDRMVLPQARSAALLYRPLDGVNQVLAVADSGGSPTASARIGDYVSAEIRRFQGG